MQSHLRDVGQQVSRLEGIVLPAAIVLSVAQLLEMKTLQDKTIVNKSVTRRSVMLVALIVLVTLFWVLMLAYTNLPTLVLGLIAVLSVLLLAVATAWTAMALPKTSEQNSVS